MLSINAYIKQSRLITLIIIFVGILLYSSHTYTGFADENNILAFVSTISQEVEKIRSLKFKSPVKVEVQTIEALNAYIEKEIQREFGEDKGKSYITALVKLGVLKEPVDISTVYSSLARSQISAHYDPYAKKYYLIMTNIPPTFVEMISSHELSHALQDQYFNLKDFLNAPVSNIRKNGDKSLAKQCLVEGEATLIMLTWLMMKNTDKTNPNDVKKQTSFAITMMASINPETLIELSEMQAENKELGFPDFTNMMEGLSDLPLFFIYTLYSSYAKGAYMVDYLKSQHGWEKINYLYKHPPTSTEQVLHPEKLVPEREEPVDVTLIDFTRLLPSEWTCREENTLGELGIISFLQLWLDDDTLAQTTAAGWGGDRYAYFTHKNSEKYLLVWKILWDTESDATEFSVAYRTLLSSRFPNLKKITSSYNDKKIVQLWEVEPSRILKLTRNGKETVVLDSNEPSILKLIDK